MGETEMKTTQAWWDEVSNSQEKMDNWLKDQYHGEVTAEKRIRELATKYALTNSQVKLIHKVADDEKMHAEWVKELLIARGISAEVLVKEERYWDKVLPTQDVSFEYMCAIGHLAETMRLERIQLLAADTRFIDIAKVFSKILGDEIFHSKAFKVMSTPEDIELARKCHKDGLNAIGLVI